MARKVFRAPIIFKADGAEGEFTAEFATLNVIDHDRDVILPGAFHENRETLIEPWNHNYGELPVGKGVIHEKDDKAIVDGKFFLETQAGLDHYHVVKALGPLQEWSFTFDIEKNSQGKFEDQPVQFLEKLDVWGVAPVTRGAGIDTRTVSIKNQTEDEASNGKSSGKTNQPEDEASNGKSSRDQYQVKNLIAYNLEKQDEDKS